MSAPTRSWPTTCADSGTPRAVGLLDIVSGERAQQVLSVLYASNVQSFGGARLRTDNGMHPDGSVDVTSDQAQEVWTGVTYALAAFMLHNHLADEAFATASGIYIQEGWRSGQRPSR